MTEKMHNADIDPWDDWLTGTEPAQPAPTVHDQAEPAADAAQGTFPQETQFGILGTSSNIEPELAMPSVEQISLLLEQLDSIELPIVETTLAVGPNPCAAAEPTPRWAETQNEVAYTVPSGNDVGNCDSGAAMDLELLQAYLDDAAECTSAIEAAVMQLDADPKSSDSLSQISRSLHTLKGASASVGLNTVADRLHRLEEDIRLDQQEARTTSVDHLLAELDWLRQQLAGMNRSMPGSHCYSDLGSIEVNASDQLGFDAGPEDDESVRVKTSQLNRLMDMLSELVMLRNRRDTEISHLREAHQELNRSVGKLRILSKTNRQAVSDNESLQIAEVAADVLEIAQRVRACTQPFEEGNQAVSRFIRQFRHELVELCRAPSTGLFQRLQRAVRDTAKSEGKSVRLESAGAASIERSLQQRLYEPLLHIVRNAVCHGIESSAQRAQVNKSPTGTILIDAISGADLLVIEVRDDGAGLNYAGIRQRAIQAGLITASQSLSEPELAQLIFHPGFSTRESVDQQAGRGIGMDVVASTLDRLGGWIDIESVAGVGTTIRLSIPLPSAIEHLMIFRCHGQLYGLPMLTIQSAGIANADVRSVYLSELFARGKSTRSALGNATSQPSLLVEIDSVHRLPGHASQQKLNLLVDEIVGPEEVVVRPLPSLVRHHQYCSGATISSTGQTTLVLDIRRLLAQASVQEIIGSSGAANKALSISENTAHQDRSPLAVKSVGESQPLVLVVDDSISSRKLVVRGLQKYPFQIIEAADGKHALQLLKLHRFAAVFSDLEMPQVDGLELLAEIRSRDNLRETPVTIISSRTEDEFVSRAQALGVTAYLNKPITDEALTRTLSAIDSLSPFIRVSQTCH